MDLKNSNEANSTNNTVNSANHANPLSSLACMAAESPKAPDLPVNSTKFQEADEDVSQEFKDLMDTLPMETDRFGAELCQYQGFWIPKVVMEGVLKCQNQFKVGDSDIVLVTLPKSGTTWLKALIFAIINRYIHNPRSQILNNNPHVLVPLLEALLQHEKALNLSSFLSSSARILASHIPYVLLPESMKQSRCKIVYLCRNPKDVFVSLWHFMSRVTPETLLGSHSLKDFFDEFCRGVSVYGPFWDHVLGYYKESLERPWKVLFFTFEELKSDPVRTLTKIAEFIGFGFSPEEENVGVVDNILKPCSFENLSNLEVNRTESDRFGIENKVYFRRGEVGDWKNLLTVDMAKRFNAIIQEKLEKHALEF